MNKNQNILKNERILYMMKDNNNPFDEAKLKSKLKVNPVGYGEKRTKRTNVVLEETIHKKTIMKCSRIGVTLNDCINQLLYIWSKDEKMKDSNNLSNEQINLFNCNQSETEESEEE